VINETACPWQGKENSDKASSRGREVGTRFGLLPLKFCLTLKNVRKMDLNKKLE